MQDDGEAMSAPEPPRCPHCGQYLPSRVADFQIGDRVYHISRQDEGQVIGIDDNGLRVKFDRTKGDGVFNDEGFPE